MIRKHTAAAAILLVLLAGNGHVDMGQSAPAAERRVRPFRLMGTESAERLIGELLRLTAPFRECPDTPELASLTSKDMHVAKAERGKARYGFKCNEWIAFACDGKGMELRAKVNPQDGVLLWHRRPDITDKIRLKIRMDEWERPALTPEQALERAKSYAIAARGSLPDDLLVEDVRYDFPPPESERNGDEDWADHLPVTTDLWTVYFRRYAGRFLYQDEYIRVSFSERYGVTFYADHYFSEPWKGTVKVSQQEAIRRSQEPADRHLEEYAKRNGAIFRLPAYVQEGRPILMNVVKGNPKAVHAVWVVVHPFRQWDLHVNFYRTTEGILEYHLDAETGEPIGSPRVVTM